MGEAVDMMFEAMEKEQSQQIDAPWDETLDCYEGDEIKPQFFAVDRWDGLHQDGPRGQFKRKKAVHQGKDDMVLPPAGVGLEHPAWMADRGKTSFHCF